jgi:hypothetical protein
MPLTPHPLPQVLDAYNDWAPWTLDDKFGMIECFYGWGSISVKIVYHGPKADVEAAVANASVFSVAGGSGTPAELTWSDFLVQVRGGGGSSGSQPLASSPARPAHGPPPGFSQ